MLRMYAIQEASQSYNQRGTSLSRTMSQQYLAFGATPTRQRSVSNTTWQEFIVRIKIFVYQTILLSEEIFAIFEYHIHI